MKFYSQQELRELNRNEAKAYAQEIRGFLVENVSQTGGHLASNLGIVEISLALARLFSPEEDRIVYDTGHQSYVHKLLTGRGDAFGHLRQYGGISGFPRRSESPCDAFGTGHSATGISAAVGFSQALRLTKGEAAPYAVAVIGDGAFTGGMVHEALNNVRRDSRLILILNDNEMSISPSVGALKKHLDRIRQRENYYSVMEKSREAIRAIPLVGKPLARGIVRLKRRLKRMAYAQSTLFETYGIRYYGPADGNDLATVERLLRAAKGANQPCILHLMTKKGKGYAPAEEDPSRFHSVSAPKKSKESPPAVKDFSAAVGKILCQLANERSELVAMTAAMCDGVGLSEFAALFPHRFFDVGIAEEHAVTACASMAASGLLPVFCVYSTFFQRAYDQMLHDVVLQGLKTVTILDRAGIVGEDGPTHHGLFDVSMTLNLPGLEIYSPATYKELARVLLRLCAKEDGQWSVKAPAVVRVPRGGEDPYTAQCFEGKEGMERYGPMGGEDAVIVTYGVIASQALEAADRLMKKGLRVAVVKLTCLKPLDGEALSKAIGSTRLCYFLEEGMERGGFGESVISDAATGKLRLDARRVMLRGIRDQFVPHGSRKQLLQHCKLDAESLALELEENLP